MERRQRRASGLNRPHFSFALHALSVKQSNTYAREGRNEEKMSEFKPWAKVYEDENDMDEDGNIQMCWYVEYEVVQGHKQRMCLDAETLSDAKFEASGITEISEDEIAED